MAKLVRCKTCGGQIAKSAKVCPHCGAKQHQGVYAVCAVIAIITLVLCVIIIGTTDLDKEGQRIQNASNESSEAKSEENNSDGRLVLDQDGIKIKFFGFKEAPYPAIGYYVNLRVENTSGKDYTIQGQDVSVDGTMVQFTDAIFSPNVLAGKTANDHIWITNTNSNGVTWPISSIELKFVLYPDGDFSNGKTSDTVTIE